jgi:hypothetical protein
MIEPPPSALDRIASAWERIATVLERIEKQHLPVFERCHMSKAEWVNYRAYGRQGLDEFTVQGDVDGVEDIDDAGDDER